MDRIDKYRLTLLERQVVLEARSEAIQRDLRQEANALSQDWEDQAQERENDEVLQALCKQTESELHEIAKALHRIQHHCYTRCAECNGEIEAERLHIQPCTELCCECIQSLENAL